jgi:hypothetical protein
MTMSASWAWISSDRRRRNRENNFLSCRKPVRAGIFVATGNNGFSSSVQERHRSGWNYRKDAKILKPMFGTSRLCGLALNFYAAPERSFEFLCGTVSTTMPRRWRYETGAGEKTGKTVSQKIFANCPCREAKAEGRMKSAHSALTKPTPGRNLPAR